MAAVISLLMTLAVMAPGGCNSEACVERVKHKTRVAHKRRVVAPYDGKLERMARCESGGNWSINTHNGYHGGLQFDMQTWRGVGGRGMPHQAGELEQKFRAVRLIKLRGYAPWPVCGRM